MPAKPKRLPLPNRFNAALTAEAYRRLRALNDEWHYGNNYLLSIILENFDEVVDGAKFQKVMHDFADEYGQPKGGNGR
ncbi:hypothetical protein [uncultured Roseibium sp.]|uniref:hypothetical protein n=1 Tax=uncultured Roseibium sp. TaxID=1936171 RepID=UPI0026056C9C|nr:hypothetical protein [uncultured Roseibium sp.]